MKSAYGIRWSSATANRRRRRGERMTNDE
jgi:hypothetical protein